MIRLGYSDLEKSQLVNTYCATHGVAKVVALSPKRFRVPFENTSPVEHIEYAEIIQYKHFYRLLQTIDHSTLVVVNECLRTQNRHDLTYNCIRHFLNQTKHQIVFQYLPIIGDASDFMTLVDFDTRSKWKREKFRPDMLEESDIGGHNRAPNIAPISITTDERTKKAYEKEKRKLIDGIGLKDPHTIPRNLHLLGGKAKLAETDTDTHYVGRNNRFKISHLTTYKEVKEGNPQTVFEFCHNFIDFSDFLTVTRQTTVSALVTDLKVDQWYLNRFTDWAERTNQVFSQIHG